MTTGEGAWAKPDTRAERVRARRARHVRVIEPAPRERKRKPARNRRLKRRYDLPLSADHSVEAQLPALPVVHPGARLFSGVMLMLVLLLLGRTLTAPNFSVAHASVSGNAQLSAAQVRSLAGVEGMPIFAIDPRAVEGALEATAEILSAEVRLGWPSSVSVRISERLPTVEWNDAGRTWWISADGLAYLPGESASGLVRIESTQHVLAVDEHELQPVVEPHLIQAAIELSGLLPEIEVFAYDPAYGLMITDEAGRRVYFGSSGDMAVKVGIYRSLAEKFSARGESVAVIHIEDSAAPYYRLEG